MTSTPQHRAQGTGACSLAVGQAAALACILEATAPKPGNVYRGADFDDLNYVDFLAAATAIAPVLESAHQAAHAGRANLGAAVLEALVATRRLVATNVNLGLILLLAPLALVRADEEWRMGLARVLYGLRPEDARDVYEAIRLAQPGGLGRCEQFDVADAPPPDLLAAMQLAAPRDLVARQYARTFDDVLHTVVPALRHGLRLPLPLADAIVLAFLTQLARQPDSLVARKCGLDLAQRVSDQAASVLSAGPPAGEAYAQALADFDFYLRADGHRRNPGTTADLIGAGLFILLRNGEIPLPLRFYDA